MSVYTVEKPYNFFLCVTFHFNPQKKGVFYKQKGQGGAIWPPRLSRLVVMGRG